MYRFLRSQLLTVAVLLTPAVFGQNLPKGLQRVATVEGITEYALPNGLHILLFPETSSPKITVNMTYLVGSRDENYGESGMAHLLEHMLFKQTQSGRDIRKDLNDHGASSNGTTSADRTTYFETVAASDENLSWALGLEADRMINVRIEKALLAAELTVVRNELEVRESNPLAMLYQQTLAAAYTIHNYRRSTLGEWSDIERVPGDELANFYRKYYQPDNAFLTISGKFDETRALQLAQATLGALPRAQRVLSRSYAIEPAQAGERYVALRRAGEIQYLTAVYHTPAITHPDSAALDVLALILGDNPSGRLYRALVATNKAASVSAEQKDRRDPGFLLVSAALRKGQSLDEARAALIDRIEGFVAEPPSQEEVDRAKSRILKQYDLGLADAEKIGVIMGECIADGDWRLLFYSRDAIKNVSARDVVRVAGAYLKASNRTLGEFRPANPPEHTEIPSAPDAAAVLKDYKGGVPLVEGEAFIPSTANIAIRLVRSRLPNGMTLLSLPKSTRGGIVTARLNLHFGTEQTLAGQSAVAQLVGDLLMAGTKRRSRQAIQDEIDRGHARIRLSGSATDAIASIEAAAQNFAGALRLTAELLRESSFPESEFAQARQRRIAGLESGKSDPMTLGSIEMQRVLCPYPHGDVRHVDTLDEAIDDLNKVDVGVVRRFHREFYGASDSECVISGPLDPLEARKLVGELFGDWKSPGPYERVRTAYRKLQPSNRKIEIADKQNAVFFAGLTERMSDEDADYPAVLLANYILGGSGASRLQNLIREKEGLSYSVSSGFSAQPKDDSATFLSMVIGAPQNVPRIEAGYKEELARACQEGFSAEEVAAAKKSWLAERVASRAQEQQLLTTLAFLEHFGRTIQWEEILETRVPLLTPEQVSAAFRRHIDPAALSFVKAGSFNKAAGFQ